MSDDGLTPNMEMYLKVILEISNGGSEPRVKMIAERLGVTMPSVSGALAQLRGKGLVGHNPYGKVNLTEEGRDLAIQVKDRNDLLFRFLSEVLGVAEETAKEDACALEHVVSRKTFNRLQLFLEFLHVCPLGPGDMIGQFISWARETDGKRAELAERSNEGQVNAN